MIAKEILPEEKLTDYLQCSSCNCSCACQSRTATDQESFNLLKAAYSAESVTVR